MLRDVYDDRLYFLAILVSVNLVLFYDLSRIISSHTASQRYVVSVTWIFDVRWKVNKFLSVRLEHRS